MIIKCNHNRDSYDFRHSPDREIADFFLSEKLHFIANLHLILYAPSSANERINKKEEQQPILPRFRKNIYTKEVIDFILEQIQNKEMTKVQIIERYNIPKTTLYKWISKYKK